MRRESVEWRSGVTSHIPTRISHADMGGLSSDADGLALSSSAPTVLDVEPEVNKGEGCAR